MAGTNQAYGATNVRDDPAYWEAQLTHINPNIRAQAQTNLARIRYETGRRQQESQFQQGQQSRAADRAAGREQRGQEFQSRQRDAQLKQQQLEAYRQSQQANQQAEQRRQQGAGLLSVAQSPLLMQLYGKDAPGLQKNLLNMFMQTQAGGAGPTGGMPLAAPTADPRTARVGGFIKGQGENVKTPITNTQIEYRNNVPQQQQAPQQAGTPNFAPSSLAAGEEDTPSAYMTPSGIPGIGGSPVIPQHQQIQHGQIYAGPKGYDLNINTGEWVPSDLVGTINGKPSTQYLAEKALKSGVSPEDTRSRGVYNQMRQGVEVPPALGDSQGSPSRDVMMLNQPKNIRAQGGPTELQGPPMEAEGPKPIYGPGIKEFNAAHPPGAAPSSEASREFLNAAVNEHFANPTMEALQNMQKSREPIMAPNAPQMSPNNSQSLKNNNAKEVNQDRKSK